MSIQYQKGEIMIVSKQLKDVAAKAKKAEINMVIDDYDKLIRRIQTLSDADPTERIMADLHITIAQSKIIANRIYQLKHYN